ncbi:hypothetical protein [Aquisalimonas asiatica]|uniref:Uncharacterized protein n=1 Tax=Aquisalimonas asiatica TaxID=406100 RepID=A0A1H8UY85_9GAMM|nr:hypothetical protein [Aquisalimonas asiatica]SEP07528.1 hypothetical protein SAMN04488052_108113 [Aquisalimonas asiatica]
MTESPEDSRRAKARPQLRGEALKRRIEAVIRELAAKARRSGKEYVYNASQAANAVPTTRKTLAKHEELVARVLEDLEARRRMVTGDATAEHLRENIAYLKEQIAERDRTIDSLRAHHVDIYQRFYAHSLDAEILIRPILEKESEQAGKCLFCGTKITDEEQFKQAINVIDLKGREDS